MTNNSIFIKKTKKVAINLLRVEGELDRMMNENRMEGLDKFKENNYAYPDIRSVKNIGIDEFSEKKGHVYKTIVVDLDSGRIIYVGEGKGKDSLEKFWKKVKRLNVNIEHIASDLSPAFTASIMENAPKAIHVFDHFHVVKLMNETLDDIRREL